MAIFVVFDGPPEKAVESLAAKVVSEDEDEAEIVVVVGVDVTEDEFKLDSAVQAVCVDDNGGLCELASSVLVGMASELIPSTVDVPLGAGGVVKSLAEGHETVPG